jgi:hypothetical protein
LPRGVLIGVAAGLRLTPGVFAVHLLITGRRRAGALALAGTRVVQRRAAAQLAGAAVPAGVDVPGGVDVPAGVDVPGGVDLPGGGDQGSSGRP